MEGNARADQSEWWVTESDGRACGPMAFKTLLERIKAGRLPRATLVCEVGSGEWRRIDETAVFRNAYGTALRQYDPARTVTAVAVPRPSNAPPPPGVLAEDGAPPKTRE